MSNTRGGLKRATISDANNPGLSVSFMFNPHQYTVSLAHQYKDDAGKGGNKSEVELSKIGQQQLTLPKIIFDTYEEGTDVTQATSKLWDLMAPIPGDQNQRSSKSKGRAVIFKWGTFSFKCFIESVKQTYTLFKQDGTPVRAEVEIKLKQFVASQPQQNPTSGHGPIQRIWRVTAGDRLDSIAAEVYADATLWRQIAEYNDIDDPYALRPGQELSIPPRE